VSQALHLLQPKPFPRSQSKVVWKRKAVTFDRRLANITALVVRGLYCPGPLTGGEVGIPAQPAKGCKGNPGSFRFSVFRGGTFLPQTGNWSSVKSHWNADVWYFKNCLRCKNKIINSINIQSGCATPQFIRFYV